MAEPGHWQQVKERLILLLKAPKENEEDNFVDTLEQAGLKTVLVPVLTFKFIHLQELASELKQIADLSGVILTSPRAVEAMTQAAALLKEQNENFVPSSVRCFAVGKATADAASHMGFHPQGCESGSAKNLSHFIIDSVKDDLRPLLYPCANIRRDTLLEALMANEINVKEIVAYETCPSETIEEDIHKIMNHGVIPDSVVFFSPSGVEFTKSLVERGVLPLKSMKVYALGPSTQQAIVRQGYHLNGVASKPDPCSILQLLQIAQASCALLREANSKPFHYQGL